MSGINVLQQKRRDAIKKLHPITAKERFKHTIMDVKKGGFISLNNENFLVASVSKYLETKWSFKKMKNEFYVTELELFSITTGKTIFIEWSYDDELEISQTKKEIKLKELTSNKSKVSKKVLEDISEEEEGEIKYNGTSFYYIEDDTWAALYFKNENSDGIPVRFFEFESDDEEYLTVELWYDEIGDDKAKREAFISEEIKPDSIKVLQLEEYRA